MPELWEDIKDDSGHITPRKVAVWLISYFIDRYKERTVNYNGKLTKITTCNIFFSDVVQQLKLPGPYHWVDKKGNPLRYMPGVKAKGVEMLANDTIDWFKRYGYGYGWVRVDREDALFYAKSDRLVAVTWNSGTRAKSGHIAILLGDGTIAQAGKGIPFVGLPEESGFGDKPREYWAHVETTGE